MNVKNVIAVIYLTLLVSSCQDVKNKVPDDDIADSFKEHAASAVPSANAMKPIQVDSSYFYRKLATTPTLNKNALDSLQAPRIFPGRDWTDDLYDYRILDTLLNNDQTSIILLSRSTDSEHWAWLIQYDRDGQLIFREPVFYEDFVEYMGRTTSIISERTCTIKEIHYMDEGEKVETHSYRLTDAGKFVKLP